MIYMKPEGVGGLNPLTSAFYEEKTHTLQPRRHAAQPAARGAPQIISSIRRGCVFEVLNFATSSSTSTTNTDSNNNIRAHILADHGASQAL